MPAICWRLTTSKQKNAGFDHHKLGPGLWPPNIVYESIIKAYKKYQNTVKHTGRYWWGWFVSHIIRVFSWNPGFGFMLPSCNQTSLAGKSKHQMEVSMGKASNQLGISQQIDQRRVMTVLMYVRHIDAPCPTKISRVWVSR